MWFARGEEGQLKYDIQEWGKEGLQVIRGKVTDMGKGVGPFNVIYSSPSYKWHATCVATGRLPDQPIKRVKIKKLLQMFGFTEHKNCERVKPNFS